MNSLSNFEAALGGGFLFVAALSSACVANNYREDEYIETTSRMWQLYSCVMVFNLLSGMIMAVLRVSFLSYVVCALSVLSCVILYLWQRVRRLDLLLREHQVPLLPV